MLHQVQESPHGSKSGLKVSEFVDQGLKQSYTLDAVGSWQITLPMPNLEGPY